MTWKKCLRVRTENLFVNSKNFISSYLIEMWMNCFVDAGISGLLFNECVICDILRDLWGVRGRWFVLVRFLNCLSDDFRCWLNHTSKLKSFMRIPNELKRDFMKNLPDLTRFSKVFPKSKVENSFMLWITAIE